MSLIAKSQTHVMLIAVLAIGLSACARDDRGPGAAQTPPQKTQTQQGKPMVATRPVVRIEPLPIAQMVEDALVDCAYIIEMYKEYQSAPIHGVEREITSCLNQMALAQF